MFPGNIYFKYGISQTSYAFLIIFRRLNILGHLILITFVAETIYYTRLVLYRGMHNHCCCFFATIQQVLTQRAIKDSIEPTHGCVCNDVRKLQSTDVLKLHSTKADWNTKWPFHILAYIYSNLLDISTSYFIKILSCRERLHVDSQRIKKNAPFIWISGVKE